MRVLVVKFSGLRGALAATAGLRTLRERLPGAQVTFVTSPGAEPALEGCPAVVETIGFDPKESSSFALSSRLRRARFDFAVALGGHPSANRLVALSGAGVRACGGRASFLLRPWLHREIFGAVVDPHEAARDHEVLARVFGFHAETPAMWFAPSRMQEHGLMVEAGRYAVLHPGHPVPNASSRSTNGRPSRANSSLRARSTASSSRPVRADRNASWRKPSAGSSVPSRCPPADGSVSRSWPA